MTQLSSPFVYQLFIDWQEATVAEEVRVEIHVVENAHDERGKPISDIDLDGEFRPTACIERKPLTFSAHVAGSC